MAIRVLTPEVVAKIAAGEVVERPASVVKELVENSLDAGATQIEVEVRGGGVSLIRVTDNGVGIPSGEVELAFERHATSKISCLDDLARLSSLGFRGEALPSIAQVSEVSLLTRTQEEAVGTFVQFRDGRLVGKSPRGCPAGTQVSVRQLFRRLPARLKFLRSTSTENQHISHLLTQYALAFPEVRFRLVIDGRLILHSPGNGKLREALTAIYGPQVGQAMLEVNSSDFDLPPFAPQLYGFISPPFLSRSNRSYLSFFVNRRWVQSWVLSRAVEQAYEGLLMGGRYPIVILNLQIPPEQVDVNIHPTKREVKFQHEGEVFRTVERVLRATLLEKAPAAAPLSTSVPQPKEVTPTEVHQPLPSPPPPESPPPPLSLPVLRVLGQIQNTYIAAEGPEGIYLIDQHAAHERVLFERLTQERPLGLEVQGLLQPLVLELSPKQEEVAREKAELLAEYGFGLEPFGGRTYLLRSVPALLQGRDLAQALLEVLDSLAEGSPEDWRRRLVTSLACQGAVRAGQVLGQAEMERLLRELEQTKNPRTCPHGRPTMIHLSTAQLEREFGRRG